MIPLPSEGLQTCQEHCSHTLRTDTVPISGRQPRKDAHPVQRSTQRRLLPSVHLCRTPLRMHHSFSGLRLSNLTAPQTEHFCLSSHQPTNLGPCDQLGPKAVRVEAQPGSHPLPHTQSQKALDFSAKHGRQRPLTSIPKTRATGIYIPRPSTPISPFFFICTCSLAPCHPIGLWGSG